MSKYRVIIEECKLFVISSSADSVNQKGNRMELIEQTGTDPTP